MASTLTSGRTGGSGSSDASGSGSGSGSAYVPTRRTFVHASTFSAGMTFHNSALDHAIPAVANVRVFDDDAVIDEATAQQRSELQNRARQVRLSVAKGYCSSTPLHTRASSFASTAAPSSDHPGIDFPSSTASVASSTVGDLPFGRSSVLPWARTQSAPVTTFMRQPSTYSSEATDSPLFNPDRANELQPYASRPQRHWEPTTTTGSSAFGRNASMRSVQHRARFADDEDGDITAISIVPAHLGKDKGDEPDPDSVLGAHFEADEAFESGGFGIISREDRQGSSSDEEEGNSSSQSDMDDFDDDLDVDEEGDAKELSDQAASGLGTAVSKQKAALPGSRRSVLAVRPNGLANKTTSLPAGPFDAANRIDEAFARRTVLRQGLENRTRTVGAVTQPQRQAPGRTTEDGVTPWTPGEFQRWTSTSDF
ncbi:hypothetical protein CF326_g1566 [Tilletia indica]|nr:hypothetical protein CF326_g1566 [Tilletia indica]